MLGRMLVCQFAVAAALAACADIGPTRDPALGRSRSGQPTSVSFTQSSELAGNSELARRLLSPLAVRRLALPGHALHGQPVDPARERFVLHVPATPPPPRGYGLMVFVPPWQEALLPRGWGDVLDRYDTIFVTAARSGNEESVLSRRAPLALLAAANVMRRYPVDPARVIISGFSGGSRTALRLALGYPDLFHAAILDAGSDPIGEPRYSLPSPALFEQFQRNRLMFITGAWDAMPSGDDDASIQSLRSWCVFDVTAFHPAAEGHRLAEPRALALALAALREPVKPLSDLAACREQQAATLSGELDQVEALIAARRLAEATSLLAAIDSRFAGLAAPRSLGLAAQLDGKPAASAR